MKIKRQNTILDLIKQYDIETQEELMEKLKRNGYNVTQATVSRDIRDLKITKKPNEHGKYRYMQITGDDTAGVKFNSVLIESIIKIDYAQNIVVIKTYPGLASAVAGGIDGIDKNEVVGCVAGDDTILVVIRDSLMAADFAEKIRELICTL